MRHEKRYRFDADMLQCRHGYRRPTCHPLQQRQNEREKEVDRFLNKKNKQTNNKSKGSSKMRSDDSQQLTEDSLIGERESEGRTARAGERVNQRNEFLTGGRSD